MIVNKTTQQSDLTRTTGKVETIYTFKPEDNAEDMKINNFINSQKIQKTTLDKFSDPSISIPNPETLRAAIEKAAKQEAEKEAAALKKVLEDRLGCPLPESGTLYLVGKPKFPDYELCQCTMCRSERGEL